MQGMVPYLPELLPHLIACLCDKKALGGLPAPGLPPEAIDDGAAQANPGWEQEGPGGCLQVGGAWFDYTTLLIVMARFHWAVRLGVVQLVVAQLRLTFSPPVRQYPYDRVVFKRDGDSRGS